MAQYKLYRGDCLKIIPQLDAKSIDLIAVDVPYGTTQNKWDIVIPFEPMWKQIKRVLKDKGTAVFTAAQPFTSQLVMSNPEWYRYDIIWQKSIGSGQLNINRQPLRLHEHLLIFYNKFGVYNEQTTQGDPYKITRKADEFEGNYGKQKEHTKINEGVRHARSVIKISNPRIKNGHKTEKPVELMSYIVKTYSNENNTVLDFTMGSGATGEACAQLNRNFIGIELDEYWFKKAEERLSSFWTWKRGN